MASLLLPIIYLAFISLVCRTPAGCGVAHHVPPAWGGCFLGGRRIDDHLAGTIVSSLASERLNTRLGTGRVTALSVATTAVALLGFSTCTEFWQLCLWGIPYGWVPAASTPR